MHANTIYSFVVDVKSYIHFMKVNLCSEITSSCERIFSWIQDFEKLKSPSQKQVCVVTHTNYTDEKD